MEIVIMIIMLMVSFSFLLKLTYHRRPGILILSLLPLVFFGISHDYAAMQSKTQIAMWLEQPALMLDTAVILTIDVAFQLTFCTLMAMKLCGKISGRQSLFLTITFWIPGILIFPVLLSLLIELIFAMPGIDFATIGWISGITLSLFIPASCYVLRHILPEQDLRLELMFLINLLIAALGIVATVNGRTAATAVNEIDWQALAGIIALFVTGTVTGILYYNKTNSRKLKKLNR